MISVINLEYDFDLQLLILIIKYIGMIAPFHNNLEVDGIDLWNNSYNSITSISWSLSSDIIASICSYCPSSRVVIILLEPLWILVNHKSLL